LWNDKDNLLNSAPAKNISVIAEAMWIQSELLGSSDGTVNQTFNTKVTPILVDDNLDLQISSTTWERVSSFANKGSTAQVYTIDTNGLITFGDGINGKIPPLGNNIALTYVPDLENFGKNIYEGLWFEVKSLGVTSNEVFVVDETQNGIGTDTVQVSNTTVTSVSGVWIQGDYDHTGTNYFTGGSFDADTGVLTLGSVLSYENALVIVSYSYIMIDDLENDYTPIGKETSHSFTNQIPSNNAKLLYFRLNLPATADPSGGSNYCFRLKLSYDQ
jgi:hypothetical protein